MRFGWVLKPMWGGSSFVVLVAAVLAVTGAAQALPGANDLTPLSSVPNEGGFGIQIGSLSSPYAAGGFFGVLDSRVFVDALPASQVTFVYDLQVTVAVTEVVDLSIAATGVQNDLRIGEIIAGVNGYVSGTTTKIPNSATAWDNTFPTVDELVYEWNSGNGLLSGGRSTLYVQTSGAVDIGQVSAVVQDTGTATALVLAPVDDPNQPDLDVPEPASLMLLGAGGLALLRRRRA